MIEVRDGEDARTRQYTGKEKEGNEGTRQFRKVRDMEKRKRTDVTESVKLVHLPPHERIIVRVRRSRDETPPPIDPRTERVQILLSDRGEVLQPVVRVGELFDLFAGDSDRFHDLELVLETGALGLEFTLLCFRGVGRRSRRSRGEGGSVSGFVGRSDLIRTFA